MLDWLEALPVIGSNCVSSGPLPAVSAAAFVEVPYTPAVLLNARFSAVITDDSAFREACAEGFEMYFFELERDMPSYEWTDMVERVFAAAAPWDMRGVPALPVTWSAGFVLGWLSAHALVDHLVALMALEVLHALIEPSLSVAGK